MSKSEAHLPFKLKQQDIQQQSILSCLSQFLFFIFFIQQAKEKNKYPKRKIQFELKMPHHIEFVRWLCQERRFCTPPLGCAQDLEILQLDWGEKERERDLQPPDVAYNKHENKQNNEAHVKTTTTNKTKTYSQRSEYWTLKTWVTVAWLVSWIHTVRKMKF